MDKPFLFSDFIDEFKVTFVAANEQTEGHYDDNGDYIPGANIPVLMDGILLPLTENDLKYSEAGTYSTQDKKIYTLEPLEIGQTINYKGVDYTIQSFKDYSDYADVYVYYARWREK